MACLTTPPPSGTPFLLGMGTICAGSWGSVSGVLYADGNKNGVYYYRVIYYGLGYYTTAAEEQWWIGMCRIMCAGWTETK